MNIFGYKPTTEFWVAVVIAPMLLWFIRFVFTRIVKKFDTASEDRHKYIVEALQETKKAIQENREAFTKKMDEHCSRQEVMHSQIDKRFWKHAHDENGDIVIRGGM